MEKVTISNLQGESGLVNVVRYFLNNGSEFLIYSLNEVDESGYTRLYVTKLNGVDGNYTADTLNDTEWADVKNLVKVIVKANKEKLPIPVQDINPSKLKNIVLKDKKIFKLNTPLVNDLAANQPNFNDDDSNGGEQKTAFDIPSAPTFDTPAQPTFDIPSAPTFDIPSTPTFDTPAQPTFDTPVQPTFDIPSAPTFDIPSTPTFDTPAQPTFDIPSAPTFDTPVQPTFDIPSAPTFDTPVQPTFDIPSTPTFDTPAQPSASNYNNFDFGATNTFDTGFGTSNVGPEQEENVQELKDEIKRLNDEISKYKEIIENVKNIVEK